MENIKKSLSVSKEIYINQVNQSLGSFFSKDDVKGVIDSVFNHLSTLIEAHKKDFLTIESEPTDALKCVQLLDDVLQSYGGRLDNTLVEICNESFSINYSNEVTLDEFDIDVTEYNHSILSRFKKEIEESFSPKSEIPA